jgi:hypothetical protein
MNHLPAVIERTGIIGDARAPVVPTLIAVAGERASLRFLEFFAANIRNPHTRRAAPMRGRSLTSWPGVRNTGNWLRVSTGISGAAMMV